MCPPICVPFSDTVVAWCYGHKLLEEFVKEGKLKAYPDFDYKALGADIEADKVAVPKETISQLAPAKAQEMRK